MKYIAGKSKNSRIPYPVRELTALPRLVACEENGSLALPKNHALALELFASSCGPWTSLR